MKLNLIFFVRILLRHIWLLVAAPVTLATLVFLLTKEEPKVFESQARVYTAFATGSTIELSQTRLDFKATNIAFENLLNLIKSKNTLEMVGLKLFTQHMLSDGTEEKIIGPEKYAKLMETVPDEVKELVVEGDPEKTYENFLIFKEKNHTNFLNELLSLSHPDYSHAKILEKIAVKRISFSDFLDIGYQSQDPGICQNTLKILCETFIRENANVKASQTDAVVAYFQNQLAETTKRLNAAERELLVFNRENRLMNYYEQTKQIAARRENFEGKYINVLQDFHSSSAVIKKLEGKLSTHAKKRLQNERILALRDEIAEINYEISMRTLQEQTDSSMQEKNTAAVADMMIKLEGAEKKLEQAVDTIFVIDHDKDGIASSNILKDWLNKTIINEGAKAQLKILDEKRIEFDQLARKYAPLGATMKKLERKINIEEQEYLSLLHSLGLAKLRQQNGELKANLEITDPPYFPLEAKPSKRMMLVVIAGVAGLVLMVILILVLEFLDGNINTATRAEDKIGLKVSSIFPIISLKKKRIDYEYLRNKAVNAISRNIILNQYKEKREGFPLVNMFFSTQAKEGKTFICQNLIAKLCELDYRILHITYDETDLGIDGTCYDKLTYPISDQLYKISEVEEFDTTNKIKDFKDFDFIVLELPDIIKNPFPVKLASTMDYTFLVTRANRAWSEADGNALDLFNQATTGPEPTIILNGVKVLEMETIVGELPKKRSFIRRWIKRLIQLRFFTKKSVA